MTDFRGPVRIEAGHLTIQGSSRAGKETYFRVREWNIGLDIGRCPDMLIGLPDVFITHAHLDHATGIPFYAAQRKLQRLDAGRVYVPAENLEDFGRLMEIQQKLTGSELPLELIGLAEGERRKIRRDLYVKAHRSTHRVVTNAYEFIEVRKKLRPDYSGREQAEITRLRRDGVDVAEEHEASILFYTGDTDRRIFERSPAMFEAEVLMIECSFTSPEDHARAERYAHIHVEDLYDVAERFRNHAIVLTHFSLRDRPDEIHREIASRCPHVLRERLRLALPAPYDRL